MSKDDEIFWNETDGKPPGETSQPIELPEGPAVIIGYPSAADWVRSPPELGNKKLRIVDTWQVEMQCSSNDCTYAGILDVVDLEENLSVICCTSCRRYSWVRTSQLKDGLK